MVPTSWNFSFKCYRWKHSFFCLSSRDTWLLSHVTFSGGKTNLHDNRAEQRRRVWSGAMFVRIFLFVDKTETSWQTLNSEEQLKLKHRLIALLWCQRQHWDQQLASANVENWGSKTDRDGCSGPQKLFGQTKPLLCFQIRENERRAPIFFLFSLNLLWSSPHSEWVAISKIVPSARQKSISARHATLILVLLLTKN